MRDNKLQPKLMKTRYGYYQYTPLPTIEELRKYYAEKYYQEGHGSYTVKYTKDEIEYFQLKAKLIYRKVSQLVSMNKTSSFIDVGCGEGWVLSEFHRQGHPVIGFDFSKHGVAKFSPQVMDYFKQGDVYKNLELEIHSARKYNVILLANVIEHVLDPIELLKTIRMIMAENALLIIVAPNDFSKLHHHLIENKYISREFWLAYPDHLSYFNKDSMTNLLNDMGYRVASVVADNPIDLNLMNDNTNYINDPSKGKITHYYRVRTDNFLASEDVDKLLAIYELLGSMGVGRDLNYYCFNAR